MQIRQIHKIDLKKLMKAKGIKTLKDLAKKSGVDYTTLSKANSGYITLSEKSWDKINLTIQSW